MFSVQWAPPQKIYSRCHMDVAKFPFDHQFCSLIFRSCELLGEFRGICVVRVLHQSEMTFRDLRHVSARPDHTHSLRRKVAVHEGLVHGKRRVGNRGQSHVQISAAQRKHRVRPSRYFSSLDVIVLLKSRVISDGYPGYNLT